MAHPLLRSAALMMVLGMFALSSGGCAPWVTYPPIEGAAHVGSMGFEPVPTVMADAIRYTNDRYARQDEIVFNLPEGARSQDYDRIVSRLGGEGRARPMMEEGEQAIHITQVRVRATDAEVDVIYPRAGVAESATLTMRQRFFNRYEVLRSRAWRIHATPPLPTYPAEPETPETPAEPVEPRESNDEPSPPVTSSAE